MAGRNLICVLFPFVGDSIGGSHLSALLLIKSLPKDRFRVIIALHRPGVLSDYLDRCGMKVISLDGVPPVEGSGLIAQSMDMLLAAPRLSKFMRDYNVDIVHTNDIRMHLTWSLAARLSMRKHIWHQRSADDSRRLSLFSKSATSILTISDHCKTSLSTSISSRAEVVYDPFDTAAKPPSREVAKTMVRQGAELNGVEFLVGFVGNMTNQKRPLDFIETAARLRDELGDRIGFVMFGELRAGLHEAVLNLISFHKLEEHVRLMGSQHPIEPWLAGTDVLLAPAVNEGLGRTLIEAALVGTPVVASDDGGHREVIENGKSGYLVPPNDPSSMAACTLKLLADCEHRREITHRAGDRARERFSVDAHVDSIIDIYKKLAS